MSALRHRTDEDMEYLRTQLLNMGALTEELIRDAIVALTTQDMALAATIIPRDDVVDEMDVTIEARCLHLLARPHGRVSDLRVIGTALKVITDIERIGDHAVDISKIAQQMNTEMMLYKSLVDIPRMGDMVRRMLHDALEAFVHRDLVRVSKVIDGDAAVDKLYKQMRVVLHKVLQEEPALVIQASHLLFVAHYLERVGDHCINIVERVSYMETGRLKELANDSPPEIGIK